MNNPCFARLRDEVDPLLGHAAGEKAFTVPGAPVAARYVGIPSAVRLRGAAYLFLPSVAALRFIEARARQLRNPRLRTERTTTQPWRIS